MLTRFAEDGKVLEGPKSIQKTTGHEAYFNSQDGNGIFFFFNLMFKTGTGISFSQYRASRRELEFHFSISGFETRKRIKIETNLARIFFGILYVACLLIEYFKKGC